jgi:hypothetical protein
MPAARPAIINDRFEVIPQDAAFGAEIRGVDLSKPIDQQTLAKIEAAYDRHTLLRADWL